MTKRHEKGRAARVGEPVQVYLAAADRERLERLAVRLAATKSDVLRRGLEALESSLHRLPRSTAPPPVPLPSFGGEGLRPGVDLDDTASLLDLMDGRGASG